VPSRDSEKEMLVRVWVCWPMAKLESPVDKTHTHHRQGDHSQTAERLPKREKWSWKPPPPTEGAGCAERRFHALYTQAVEYQERQEPKTRWRREWETPEVIEATRKKALACEERRRNPCNRTKRAWKQARSEAKKVCRKAANDYWQAWADQVDTALDVGDATEAFRLLRNRYKKKPVQLPEGEERLEGCRTHFEQLLAPEAETGDWDELASPPLPEPARSTRRDFADDGGDRAGFTVRISETGEWWQVECEGDGRRHQKKTWRTWSPANKAAGRTQATLCATLFILQEWKPTYRRICIKCTEAAVMETLLGKVHAERDQNYHGIREELRDAVRELARLEIEELCCIDFERSEEAELKKDEPARLRPWQPLCKADAPRWAGVPDYPPTRREIRQVLHELKKGAPGADGIRAETLRQPEMEDPLVELIQAIWKTGEPPSAFRTAVLVALPKKPGATAWTDHRGITLLSVAGKVLTRVMYNRAKAAPIREGQHGFRRNNSTQEAILVLKLAMEKARRTGQPICLTFVDLAKAYDSVPRSLLWDTARKYGMSEGMIRILKALYDDDIFVSLGGAVAPKPFHSTQGVRQGCLLSPLLFNWVFDRVLRTAEPNIAGIPMVGGRGTWTLKYRAYADDLAITSRDRAAAQADFSAFAEACKKARLVISVKKTQTLTMPDKRPRKELGNQVHPPQGVKVTPTGEWYHVMGRVPKCPTCGDKLKNDVCLRNHFDKMHQAVVNVLKAEPVCVEIADVSQARGGKWQCNECGTGNFSSEKTATTHWRKRRCVHKEQAPTVWMSGARKALLAPRPCSAAMAENAATAAGLPIPPTNPPPVEIEGERLAEVNSFVYLGRVLNARDSDADAVSARISVAAKTAAALRDQVRKASKKTRLKVFNTVIRAQLLYGAGTWAVSTASARKLESFYMRWVRRLSGLNPTIQGNGTLKYPRTTKVLAVTKMPPVLQLVDQQRLRFVGHVIRRGEDDVVRRMLEDSFPLKSRPGITAKLDLSEQIRELMARAEVTAADANDRAKWRSAVKGLREGNAREGLGVLADG
jgi:hypothetical protein